MIPIRCAASLLTLVCLTVDNETHYQHPNTKDWMHASRWLTKDIFPYEVEDYCSDYSNYYLQGIGKHGMLLRFKGDLSIRGEYG